MSSFFVPIFKRATREITGAGWVYLEHILFLLQVVLPGMVWFKRVDGNSKENSELVMAQRIHPAWMKAHKKVLLTIINEKRFKELHAIFKAEWDNELETFSNGI